MNGEDKRSSQEEHTVGWICMADMFLLTSVVFLLFAGLGFLQNRDTGSLRKDYNALLKMLDELTEIYRGISGNASGINHQNNSLFEHDEELRLLSWELAKIMNADEAVPTKRFRRQSGTQSATLAPPRQVTDSMERFRLLLGVLGKTNVQLTTEVAYFDSQNSFFGDENNLLSDRITRLKLYVEELQKRIAELEGEANKLQQWLERVEEEKRKLLEGLKDSLRREGFTVEIDPQKGVLRLPESLLFESGSATLENDGRRALSLLGRGLIDVFQKYSVHASEIRLEAVFIEGHTDNVPISNANFADNWELSTARAVNSYRALTSQAAGVGAYRNRKNEQIFSVSGYGEERPVAWNGTDIGRAKNRRIDIRFEMEPPPLEFLERLGR